MEKNTVICLFHPKEHVDHFKARFKIQIFFWKMARQPNIENYKLFLLLSFLTASLTNIKCKVKLFHINLSA